MTKKTRGKIDATLKTMNRKRVRRQIGTAVLGPKPNTSRHTSGDRICPISCRDGRSSE